jgi:hypothetical protein
VHSQRVLEPLSLFSLSDQLFSVVVKVRQMDPLNNFDDATPKTW